MLEVMNSLYEHAYEGLDRDVGLEIAEESHKKQARTPGIGYFYGELSWLGAWNLVGLAKPKVGDVFLDMGSGLGKMVLSTAMTRRFKQCVGVEILPELHQKACDAVTKLRESVGEDAFGMLPPIKLECGDMLAVDVGDADVVYCFATCFSPEIMGALESKLSAEMKPGARLVLVSKQMESNAFEPWGPNDGYVSVEQAHSKWNLDCYLYRKREESFDVSSSSATHRVAW
jgi:hypothetical protein|tara:strand:+ start:717 stop:1403 length:687 start_codon:yes stop_codon:yes gene_type:complete